MEPLIVLFGTFAVVAVLARLGVIHTPPARRGRIAMAAMLLLTGASHYVMTRQMVEMVPSFFPAPLAIVYVTGVLEMVGAIGLVTRYHRLASWGLILLLLAMFPANVYAALHHTGMGGHRNGVAYLWLRAPMQLLFIAWLAWFSRDRARPHMHEEHAPGVP
jgi:uncharacterized membrane protein